MPEVSELSTTFQDLHLDHTNHQDLNLPPFLRLSRELRDEIYKYLVLFTPPPIPFPLDRSQKDEIYITTHKREKLDLSIFRVNQQIHSEATEIFYRLNTFSIQVTTNLHKDLGCGSMYLEVFWEAPWESIGYTVYEDQ